MICLFALVALRKTSCNALSSRSAHRTTTGRANYFFSILHAVDANGAPSIIVVSISIISFYFFIWVHCWPPRSAITFYMTFERIKEETPVLKGAPPSTVQPSSFGISCMISHRRYLSHRTSKFSSNRHRKLQPFRETWGHQSATQY